MKNILIALLVFYSIKGICQDYKRTSWWHFGNMASLHFSDTTAVADTTSALVAIEGCASISDTNGNLLFYTNGRTVWNRDHSIMTNGTGLLGELSSTQTAIIIPNPTIDTIFYIVTVSGGAAGDGLRYSEVYFNAFTGRGIVVNKNTLLQSDVTEKLTATRHANGFDYWVIAHSAYGDNYFTYLITETGINPCPIINHQGHSFNGLINLVAAMKFSFDGRRLATSLWCDQKIEFFDFNSSTGILSNPKVINNLFCPYGVEFSEKGKFLYVTERGARLLQFDVSSNNETIINASAYSVFDFTGLGYDGQALQLARNSKIYLAIKDSMFLAQINNPDSLDSTSNFQFKGVSLSKRKSLYGLPNFVTSFLDRFPIQTKYLKNCNNRTVTLESFYSGTINTINWKIYNSTNTIIATLSGSSPTFTFPDTGDFQIKTMINSDSLIKPIRIDDLNFPNDTVVCNKLDLKLTLSPTMHCVMWDDSTDSSSRTFNIPGKYYVSAVNSEGCKVSDTISIKFATIPIPAIIRFGDTLRTDIDSVSYKWYYNNVAIAVGGASESIKAVQNGNYKVVITNEAGCSSSSADYPVNWVSANHHMNFNSVRIYPNPVTDELFMENVTPHIEIGLFDISGKKLSQIKSANASVSIDMHEFSKGIYILKIDNNYYKVLKQ